MWFKLKEIMPNLFQGTEPGHVSFYILRSKTNALFIDSGLGIATNDFAKILENLRIFTFDVLATHFHCDHVGSNYLASKVYANDKEWEKYQSHHDEGQIFAYYEILKAHKAWPYSVSSKTIDFSSKIESIGDGKLQIGEHEFEVLHTPGHTCGHMKYISHEL
jgi:glyoxylase-like metal-dependent hydrolase (beta-lactamase superfamily II)